MIETIRTGLDQPVKLGVVYLGPVCGKHKYTLLEEDDIEYARQFTLEPTLNVDPNGAGACIYVTGRKTNEGSSSEAKKDYFHDLLWIRRFGPIVPGCRISHKNGITVDNRVANLEVVDVHSPRAVAGPVELSAEERESRARGTELYRLALSELPTFGSRLLDQHQRRTVNADGVESVSVVGVSLYECRHASCCKLEQPGGVPFKICPACGDARYCSDECMRQDAEQHAKDCCADGSCLYSRERTIAMATR